MYHKVYDINWRGRYPNHSAMYIDDGGERDRNQLMIEQQLDHTLAISMRTYLEEHNPLIAHYRQLGMIGAENARIVFEPTTSQVHGAQFEQPISREVAVILTTESTPYNPRQITIWKNREDSHPKNVSILHPLYEPLQYPLLYPHGTPGWYPERRNSTAVHCFF